MGLEGDMSPSAVQRLTRNWGPFMQKVLRLASTATGPIKVVASSSGRLFSAMDCILISVPIRPKLFVACTSYRHDGSNRKWADFGELWFAENRVMDRTWLRGWNFQMRHRPCDFPGAVQYLNPDRKTSATSR